MGLIDGLISLVIRGVLESGKAPTLNRMADNVSKDAERMQRKLDKKVSDALTDNLKNDYSKKE